MNFRIIEIKVKILKYKCNVDMLWIISIILIPNMHIAFYESKNSFPDFEIYPPHVLKY